MSAHPTPSELTEEPTRSVQEWWAKHAALLSNKMAIGGVKSFHIEHVSGKRYTFSVIPFTDADPDTNISELARRICHAVEQRSDDVNVEMLERVESCLRCYLPNANCAATGSATKEKRCQ